MDHKPMNANGASSEIDEIGLLRARQYDLLARLLGRAPTPDLLEQIAEFRGNASPLGLAYEDLARAAGAVDSGALSREFLDLFVGVGRGEFLPYASYYLTGFLYERPLARVREDMARLGVERAEHLQEPEDHIAILCEVMAGLASRRFAVEFATERRFFERHLKPWAPRFFADLEAAKSARFYRAVGTVGRIFTEIEAQAFTMELDLAT
jgi:TorA maturation chaperone TorD